MGGERKVTDFPTALKGRDLSRHEPIGHGSSSIDRRRSWVVREILSDMRHELVNINLLNLLHVVHEVSLGLFRNVPCAEGSDLRVLLALRRSACQVVVAYEERDGTTTIGEFLGTRPRQPDHA
jgi:hypothetical protein